MAYLLKHCLIFGSISACEKERFVKGVEVVYRYEENLGAKGSKNKKFSKDVAHVLTTMPQVAGKKPRLQFSLVGVITQEFMQL